MTSRLDAAIRLIRDRSLGGLVVYSDGSCNILRASHFRYFVGLAPLGPHACAVVAAEGQAALIVQPGWDAARARRQSWIHDVRGTEDVASSLTAVMREFRVRGSIGLAGASLMPFPVRDALQRHIAIQPADDLVERMALDKSTDEIALVRKTAEAADAGFAAFRSASRVGVSEYEIVAEVEYAMRRAGADDN